MEGFGGESQSRRHSRDRLIAYNDWVVGLKKNVETVIVDRTVQFLSGCLAAQRETGNLISAGNIPR